MPLRLEEDNVRFSENYKIILRNQWFRMGKPSAKRLLIAIPADTVAGRKPNFRTLDIWIREDFKPFAEQLDEQLNQEMNDRLIKDKVEMLTRHKEEAKEVRQIALDWIRNNRDKLNAISAARLFAFGTELERQSTGIPAMLEKLANMKDEDVMKRIQDIVSRAPVEIQQIELPEEIIDEEFKDE